MITVKLYGNLKQLLQKDSLVINLDGKTIHDLIEYLINHTNGKFDGKNMIIAINGTDSNALDGTSTILQADDTASIIPIIHGGSDVSFTILNHNVYLFPISKHHKLDANFITDIRRRYPRLVIQGISVQSVLGFTHMKKIISISLHMKKNKALLSKKLETDILMRFALNNQITQSLKLVGLSRGFDFILIIIGNRADTSRLNRSIKHYITTPKFNTVTTMKRKYALSKKHIDSIQSTNPVEDILVEKASILF